MGSRAIQESSSFSYGVLVAGERCSDKTLSALFRFTIGRGVLGFSREFDPSIRGGMSHGHPINPAE
jgi:hypothetical protein